MWIFPIHPPGLAIFFNFLVNFGTSFCNVWVHYISIPKAHHITVQRLTSKWVAIKYFCPRGQASDPSLPPCGQTWSFREHPSPLLCPHGLWMTSLTKIKTKVSKNHPLFLSETHYFGCFENEFSLTNIFLLTISAGFLDVSLSIFWLLLSTTI